MDSIDKLRADRKALSDEIEADKARRRAKNAENDEEDTENIEEDTEN